LIVCDDYNPKAVLGRAALVQRVPEDIGGDELVVVIGGDGFLLQTVETLGLHRTYLGLNAGHLGFLLNDVDDWDRVAGLIASGGFAVRHIPVLTARVLRRDGVAVEDFALNDVYLERMTSQTARIKLSIDGTVLVDPLVADGVILSTAIGSTAYAFSAGGPAVHPDLHVIGITPICPHQPRLGAMLVPPSSVVRIDVLSPDRRPVRCVADGRGQDAVATVEIRLGPAKASLAHLEGHDPTARLVRKLMRA
jgi:NAD+ kinase